MNSLNCQIFNVLFSELGTEVEKSLYPFHPRQNYPKSEYQEIN